MSEETRVTTITDHPVMQGIIRWFVAVVTVFVLGIGAYGVFLMRVYLPFIGTLYIVIIALLPIIGLIALIVWLVRFVTKSDVIEIGPSGTIVKWFHKVTFYHPLGVQEYHTGHTKEKDTQVFPEIPPLLSLLKEGVLGAGDLLLGYHIDGSLRWGLWSSVRTFLVAGKSRSGKTVTMVFFIVQALLGGAEVWVCDIHYNKRSGLLKVLEPLLPYIRVARTHAEIMMLVTDYSNEMNSRETGTSEMGLRPILLVVDEWTKLLRDLDSVEKTLLVDAILNCAESWADFEGYAMIAGHEWTANESGGKKGAALRRNMHAVFVHRLDEEYAKFLLKGSKGRKASKETPNLHTGHAQFQDSEGELDYLLIPFYGREREAVCEAARILRDMHEGIAPSASYPLLDSPHGDTFEAPVYTPVDSKQSAYTPVNGPVNGVQGDNAPVYSTPETSKLESENEEGVSTFAVNGLGLKTLIERMRSQNIPHRKIAKTVMLDGRKYPQYKQFCTENNIPVDETEEVS